MGVNNYLLSGMILQVGGGLKDYSFSPRSLGKWTNLTVNLHEWMVILNMRFDIGTGDTKINGTKGGVLNRDPPVVESCGPVSNTWSVTWDTCAPFWGNWKVDCKDCQRMVLQKHDFIKCKMYAFIFRGESSTPAAKDPPAYAIVA